MLTLFRSGICIHAFLTLLAMKKGKTQIKSNSNSNGVPKKYRSIHRFYKASIILSSNTERT